MSFRRFAKLYIAAVALFATAVFASSCSKENNGPDHQIVGRWLAQEYVDTFYIDRDMAGEPVRMAYPDDKPVDKRLMLEVRYDKKNDYFVGSMKTYNATEGTWDGLLSPVHFTLTDNNDIKFPVNPFINYSAEIHELDAEWLHATIRVSGSMSLLGTMFPDFSLDQLEGHRFANIFDCRFSRAH